MNFGVGVGKKQRIGSKEARVRGTVEPWPDDTKLNQNLTKSYSVQYRFSQSNSADFCCSKTTPHNRPLAQPPSTLAIEGKKEKEAAVNV